MGLSNFWPLANGPWLHHYMDFGTGVFGFLDYDILIWSCLYSGMYGSWAYQLDGLNTLPSTLDFVAL